MDEEFKYKTKSEKTISITELFKQLKVFLIAQQIVIRAEIEAHEYDTYCRGRLEGRATQIREVLAILNGENLFEESDNG
jgi:hypothetical protein